LRAAGVETDVGAGRTEQKGSTLKNDVQITPHFRLSEFEDRLEHGLVVHDPALSLRLELLRFLVRRQTMMPYRIIVTSGTRTERSNQILARQLGWLGEGGLVSPQSRHLPKFAGIAADIQAIIEDSDQRLPSSQLLSLAETVFPYCKAIDAHSIHVDLEERPC